MKQTHALRRKFLGQIPLCRIASLVLVLLAPALRAADVHPAETNMGDLSLEELMNESVTSVSRKEQRLVDAGAAVSVLSNDDLARSGATSMMDALRLIPGANVSQVNAREWAISARGFNNVFSNKLLVLVDGRAVYSPVFAGVFWDLQQMMLSDVDRIEMIRGPGAAVWGANAVNGVINVVSRDARDTQGGRIEAGGGDYHESLGGVRYGGQISPTTYYRVFANSSSEDDFTMANGLSAHDAWKGRHGGFRVDHYSVSDTQVTWQADASDVKFDGGTSSGSNVNTLGRWTRVLSDQSRVEVQAYYDHTARAEATRLNALSNTIDLTAQHNFSVGPGHNVIWGVGYRYIESELTQTNPFIQVRRSHIPQSLVSAFVQGEFAVQPDKLIFTVGGKIEHNDYTGWEFQPRIGAVFKPTRDSAIWTSVSRAVRTPSGVEGKDALGVIAGAPLTGPDGGIYLPTLVGNARPASEVLLAYEAGYRIQASRRVSVDLAVYYNEYRSLIGNGGIARFAPGTPLGVAEIPFINLSSGQTYGGEASVTVSPLDHWRITAAYSQLVERLQDPIGGSGPDSPPHQMILRSSYDFTSKISLDVQMRVEAAIGTVPAYTTADFRLAYRWSKQLEFSLVGRNLFDPQHPEQPPIQATVTTEVPREFYGKITWQF